MAGSRAKSFKPKVSSRHEVVGAKGRGIVLIMPSARRRFIASAKNEVLRRCGQDPNKLDPVIQDIISAQIDIQMEKNPKAKMPEIVELILARMRAEYSRNHR